MAQRDELSIFVPRRVDGRQVARITAALAARGLAASAEVKEP